MLLFYSPIVKGNSMVPLPITRRGLTIPYSHPRLGVIKKHARIRVKLPDAQMRIRGYNRPLPVLNCFTDNKADKVTYMAKYIPHFHPTLFADDEIKEDHHEVADVDQTAVLNYRPGLTFKNDDQKGAWEQMQRALAVDGINGGIVSLPCGWGKTRLAVMQVVEWKKRTVIVVPNNTILVQWIREFFKVTDITVEDVGIYNGIEKTPDLANRKVLFTTTASLSRCDPSDMSLLSYDAVVFDEVHRIATEHFMRALLFCQTTHTLGLSATPNRKDECEGVFFNYLGPMLCKRERPPNRLVTCHHYTYKFTDVEWTPIYTTRNGKRQIEASSTMAALVQLPTRMLLITTLCHTYASHDTPTLVLSASKRVLYFYAVLFCRLFPDDIKVGVVTGDENMLTREHVYDTADLIFATAAIAAEGLDVPRVRRIINASPKGDIEQAFGRNQREIDHDNLPAMVDVHDHNIFRGLSNQRKAYYKKQQCTEITHECPVPRPGQREIVDDAWAAFDASWEAKSKGTSYFKHEPDQDARIVNCMPIGPFKRTRGYARLLESLGS